MLEPRPWVRDLSNALAEPLIARATNGSGEDVAAWVDALVDANDVIHRRQCINLNPAGNVMNPRAEALLSRGLSSRPSLGYPGLKHETGLEAIEKIEVVAAALAAEVFGARFVELRLPTGCMANLCAFMAIAKPGDTIVAPPPSIGGHASHHSKGAAGLYGLNVMAAPVDSDNYTVDLSALTSLCRSARPKIITIGGSLNLYPHRVADIRAIADDVGAIVVYDAAHVAGLIAGGAWQEPLREGAHIMTMSTYKSLAGPPGGLILTNDPDLAARIERTAFPGLTANFDVARAAALAITLCDMKVHGAAYARAMIEAAQKLAESLAARDIVVFGQRARRFTVSHQFALEAAPYGGGHSASRRLRQANLLTSGIGLPLAPVAGDSNGIRIGTPELVRIGMTAADMGALGEIIAEALLSEGDISELASRVAAMRDSFTGLHFVL